jgi:ribosomal protein S18 acetylase RimI-like enzyme
MSLLAVRKESAATALLSTLGGSLTVHALSNEHEAEVLGFLAMRPVHTVIMTGFIRDNGLVSSLNRGTFYACRDRQGRLEGVALIGHFVLFEAHSEPAMAIFARLAQDCPSAHMILGQQEKVECFWSYFAQAGRAPQRICRELLFEMRWPIEPCEVVPGLRKATPDDLDLILPVYAAMQESGVDPLEVDPEGFRRRWLRRIEQSRVWVWIENGRLIFNADIISDTAEVIYLEGIYVDPQERDKGYALRCLSQLSHSLLSRAKTLCLFVNEQNQRAQTLYHKAGFMPRGCYDTIYLHREN